MAIRNEYSLGATGAFRRDVQHFPGAVRAAITTGQRAHLYRLVDGRRLFVGYVHTDGHMVDADGRKLN